MKHCRTIVYGQSGDNRQIPVLESCMCTSSWIIFVLAAVDVAQNECSCVYHQCLQGMKSSEAIANTAMRVLAGYVRIQICNRVGVL